MAYDEVLADRMRALLEGRDDVTEKKMFGGLAFLVDGHMAVAVSGNGGMMLRVDPDASSDLLAVDGIAPMVMRERAIKGWLLLDPDVLGDGAALETYVARGVGFARTLPPKV